MLRTMWGALLLVAVSIGIGAILTNAITMSGLSFKDMTSLKDMANVFAAKPVIFQLDADAEGQMIGLVEPPGAKSERVPASAGGIAATRLSGVQSNASSGGTPGIYLRLPDDFETAASGQTVRMTVTARSAAVMPSPAFAVAYSTNDVGNSGWRSFPLTDKLAEYSFTFSVPKMKTGNSDYIGILPDPSGAGGAVEVSAISAEVVPAGTAAAP